MLQSRMAWALPDEAYPFASTFYAAENQYELPRNLLARVAWQESRFIPAIISGSTQSSAGAIGIMQIVPRWHPDVNPYDPIASIYYAGRYLRDLSKMFGGDLTLALAAYNWGPGNVRRNLRDGKLNRVKRLMQDMPRETRDYVAEIAGDLHITGLLA